MVSLTLPLVPLLDAVPERQQEEPETLQQADSDHPVLVVPPPPLPHGGGDGGGGRRHQPEQAAGEGLVAEQETLPAGQTERGERPLPRPHPPPPHRLLSRQHPRAGQRIPPLRVQGHP